MWAGHNLQGFSDHSLWHGGAYFILSYGVPGELIIIHMDWNYSVQDKVQVSSIMAGAPKGL